MKRIRPLTDRELDLDAIHLAKVAARCVGADLTETVRRAHDFTSGGHKASTTGGGTSSDISDPTGQAAVNAYPDPTAAYMDMVSAAFRQHVDTGERLNRVMTMILSHAGEKPARESTVPQCVNRLCGDDILEGGSAGRCEPCAGYRDSHGLDAPKHVIDGRKRKRQYDQRQRIEPMGQP